ncbi:unnamed protein product [Arctia plantaginis]|uniref:PiggyBac transposable element-derived protein domain-containing protein n=1 Tax=Arctia plantaginis TaxID=874455 RepID=A0A8S1AU57_ARCPL|nr:unnamed protein product [Arctia plantaginis]
MASGNNNIERWLEQDSSDDEQIPNDEYSDVESDVEIGHVLEESRSDSEGEELLTVENEEDCLSPSNCIISTREFSSEDDEPLSQIQSRGRKKKYFGKNRFRWSSAPSSTRSRTLQHNIMQEREGVKPAFRSAINSSTSPLDIWQQFFTDEIFENIVVQTNIKIRQMRPKYQNSYCVQDLDLMELKAFIGFLFYTAIFKENREHYTSWYSTDGTGREIYRCIMSKNRLEVLLNAIRFDDTATRPERRAIDSSAPIADLFKSFIDRCQALYAIGSYASIDEMLVPFRGRCKFKVYMPKKPAKYGIKIQCLTDARSGYLLNAYIYVGKDSDSQNLPAEYQGMKKPTQAVMRLIPPIEGSRRNVTTDNWYTSIELLELLKKKQLTGVGTMRKNQKEIPRDFLPNSSRNVDSTIFGFTKDYTISSYVPKKNRAVITVSSMHHMPDIDDTSKKPEVILFYNKTKIGVDLLDQRCSNYSTSRRTRRWPLAIFYRLLDISASNSYVVSLSVTPQGQKVESRFKFLKRLAEQLVRPHLERRVSNVKLQRDIRNAIRSILNKNEGTTLLAVPSSSTAEERLTRPPKLGFSDHNGTAIHLELPPANRRDYMAHKNKNI